MHGTIPVKPNPCSREREDNADLLTALAGPDGRALFARVNVRIKADGVIAELCGQAGRVIRTSDHAHRLTP